MMAEISGSPEVMRYFPERQSLQQTEQLIQRMNELFEQKQYCYFAVETLQEKNFIGFIGLQDIDYPAPFTPATDIGWRLHPQQWYKGYAIEGAKACLGYGFLKGLQEIVAVAPAVNLPSIAVMKRAEMKLAGSFNHPHLSEHKWLQQCVYYSKYCN